MQILYRRSQLLKLHDWIKRDTYQPKQDLNCQKIENIYNY